VAWSGIVSSSATCAPAHKNLESQSSSIDLDTRLKASRVAKRYGVSVRTIDRWLTKPNIAFPAPTLVLHDVAGRPCVRLWRLGDLVQWERTASVRHAQAE
jgi:hypothetical protein